MLATTLNNTILETGTIRILPLFDDDSTSSQNNYIVKVSQTGVRSLISQGAEECKTFCILINCYSSIFVPSWNPALESYVKGRKEPRILIKHNLLHKIMSTQHCQPLLAVPNMISFSFSGVLYLSHITFYFNSAFLVFSF